jgi:peptidoglycan-associated lipoprotein
MKSIVFSSVAAALLIFTGCSTKKPAVDEKEIQTRAQEVAPVQTETVISEDSSVSGYGESINSRSGMKSVSELENELKSVYFDFDKFSIRSNMQDTLSKDASIVKEEANGYSVKLEGNCDEWGSDEYNFALGLKRAQSVKKAMVAEGVPAESITMVSYGESNPICHEKTQECWAKSRRVDFKLLP